MAIGFLEDYKAKRQRAKELREVKEKAYRSAYGKAARKNVVALARHKARMDAKRAAEKSVFGYQSPINVGLGIDRQRAMAIAQRERSYGTAFAFGEPPARRVRVRRKVKGKRGKKKTKTVYRMQPTQDSFWL